MKTFVTDGQDLAECAERLKEDGYTDVTVNINTFNHTRYNRTYDGKHLDKVIEGINKATGQKLGVRLNVEITEGFNDDEIPDFLQLSLLHKFDIVFLPTVSYDLLKSRMPSLRKIEGDFGDLEMFKYPGGKGRIGFLKD